MKRLIISTIMVVISTAAMAQVFPDTLKKVIEGKTMCFPIEHRSEDYVEYATYIPFTENDTTFIYRAYEYYQESDGSFTCDPASYFILSHKRKDHEDNVDRINSRSSHLKQNEMPTLAFLEHNMEISLHETFVENPVGKAKDMPRMLYPLLKYGDSYYFSEDKPTTMEFYGNLLVYYGQEYWSNELMEFKKLPDGGWSYIEDESFNSAKYEVSLVPCSHLKGAYVMTRTSADGKEEKSLWTDHQHIHNFDIIGWTGPHVNVGYKCYDEIDFDALK